MRTCAFRTVVLTLVIAFGLAVAQATAADKPKDYPNRAITIQVGFGAGGSSDVGVRVLAEALKKIIGQLMGHCGLNRR